MKTQSTRSPRKTRTRSGEVKVSVDDYDMNDLAGEITRTLAACEALCDSRLGLDDAPRSLPID